MDFGPKEELCTRCGGEKQHSQHPPLCELCWALTDGGLSPNPRLNPAARAAFPRGVCERCGRVPTTRCVAGKCPTFEVGNRSYQGGVLRESDRIFG